MQGIINSLLRPSAYPHPAEKIRLIQTHISFVFLAGKFVYKIKKPVKFSFLDFSTPAKRKFYCKEEAKLNNRLSKGLYLGVVPITKSAGGFKIGGKGKAVEFAVKMKQLPEDKKMDFLLRRNRVSEKQIREIAQIIAEFHSKAATIRDMHFSSPEQIWLKISDLNSVKKTVKKYAGKKYAGKIGIVLSRCSKFISANKKFLEQRQKQGRIKDCHGDLHSGNIFLSDKTYIFDCIEFNKDFRFNDVASEIAFMAMDLDAFRKPKLSNAFVEEYLFRSQDFDALKLLDFYKCYRANVRAKVNALQLMQPLPAKEKRHKIKELKKYLELAEEYSAIF